MTVDPQAIAGAHRRYNPLTREWVLVSPQRTQRPWIGQVEPAPPERRMEYDPQCYLCPGNRRMSGAQNPQYEGAYVFDNDFPAMLPATAGLPDSAPRQSPLLVSHPERGICRVVCFSPRHDLSMAELSVAEIHTVVDVWCQQYSQLAELQFINAITIFENRGETMGASNPHPHGQIWANESVPNELRKEGTAQEEYLQESGQCMLCNYLEMERGIGERLVLENTSFVTVVPFWATWPFETLVLSKRHIPSVSHLRPTERGDLAQMLSWLTRCYDNLFGVPFPYSMGFHQQPCDSARHPAWHLHAHYYPPLLRSASVRKFLVGYEMLAQPQRDLTSETAAEMLRQAARSL